MLRVLKQIPDVVENPPNAAHRQQITGSQQQRRRPAAEHPEQRRARFRLESVFPHARANPEQRQQKNRHHYNEKRVGNARERQQGPRKRPDAKSPRRRKGIPVKEKQKHGGGCRKQIPHAVIRKIIDSERGKRKKQARADQRRKPAPVQPKYRPVHQNGRGGIHADIQDAHEQKNSRHVPHGQPVQP